MNKLFYKIALHKRYFDEGFSLINYTKYFLMVGAGASVLADVNTNLIYLAVLGYGIFCYALGWWICNYGLLDAMLEVTNNFNPYVKQMRKKFGIANK